MTARAMGARKPPPSPKASAMGSIPKIIAAVVIMMGRKPAIGQGLSQPRRESQDKAATCPYPLGIRRSAGSGEPQRRVGRTAE